METKAADVTDTGIKSARLASIDALRGFDMFWIIGGGQVLSSLASIWPNPVTRTIREHMDHVRWEGCHFEDLIYPLFLFLIGTVLPFSLVRRSVQGESSVRVYLHFLKRSLLLIVLGSIPGGLLRFDGWPFLGGVLAHIGVCYLPAAILVRNAGWRVRAGVAGGYLVLYWLASLFIPVPEYGPGVFTEAGSLASYIDHLFITGRLWNEGPTSILSGVTIILIGSLAGDWLRSPKLPQQKAAGLAWAGMIAVIAGLLWSFSFPLIKRVVWSSSYVTFACGWSLLMLALFYWIIDVRGYRRWAYGFEVIGVNAITIYFLQSIVKFKDISGIFVEGLANHAGDFRLMVVALGVLGLKWWLLWFMYRRKIFFKL